MIRVLLVGDFWNRQPLAYAPVRDRLADRIEFVEDAADAQIVLFSHTHDLTNHARKMCTLLAAHPRLRLVLLSEEPFWDTCWSRDPFAKYQSWTDGPAPFGYSVLNHATSTIYDTQDIPYFLLTDPRYIARLKPLLDRNAGLGVADWQALWRKPKWDAAFMAERRDDKRHAPNFAAREVWGLSGLRGQITLNCKGASILRAGRGWDSDGRRNELADWHGDKLARLDRNCRYVSAMENTHQWNYVTEKIYDAFAVGGIPLYIATPRHAAHRYFGSEGWINLEAHLPRKDAPKPKAFDAGTPPGTDLAKAYAAVQGRLARLFSTPSVVEDELDRLAHRLETELRALAI